MYFYYFYQYALKFLYSEGWRFLSGKAILLVLIFVHKNVCPYFAGIRVEVCGVAVVRWNKPDNKTDREADDYSGDCNKEVYFHKKIPLSSKGESDHRMRCSIVQYMPMLYKLY